MELSTEVASAPGTCDAPGFPGTCSPAIESEVNRIVLPSMYLLTSPSRRLTLLLIPTPKHLFQWRQRIQGHGRAYSETLPSFGGSEKLLGSSTRTHKLLFPNLRRGFVFRSFPPDSSDFKGTIAEASPQRPLVVLQISSTRAHYSTAPLHELDPISIAEMEFNVVHRGRVLLRIASLSTRTVGITQLIAEDLRGWAVPLILWQLPLIDSDSRIGEYLSVGSVIGGSLFTSPTRALTLSLAINEPSLRSVSE